MKGAAFTISANSRICDKMDLASPSLPRERGKDSHAVLIGSLKIG